MFLEQVFAYILHAHRESDSPLYSREYKTSINSLLKMFLSACVLLNNLKFF